MIPHLPQRIMLVLIYHFTEHLFALLIVWNQRLGNLRQTFAHGSCVNSGKKLLVHLQAFLLIADRNNEKPDEKQDCQK